MRGPVLSIFKLFLRISFKLTLDIIYTSSRVTKIFVKEDLEFVSEYKNIRSFLKYMPVLLLSLVCTNTVLKKRGCKQSAIIAGNTGYIKRVFVVLAKLVVIQV